MELTSSCQSSSRQRWRRRRWAGAGGSSPSRQASSQPSSSPNSPFWLRSVEEVTHGSWPLSLTVPTDALHSALLFTAPLVQSACTGCLHRAQVSRGSNQRNSEKPLSAPCASLFTTGGHRRPTPRIPPWQSTASAATIPVVIPHPLLLLHHLIMLPSTIPSWFPGLPSSLFHSHHLPASSYEYSAFCNTSRGMHVSTIRTCMPELKVGIWNDWRPSLYCLITKWDVDICTAIPATPFFRHN